MLMTTEPGDLVFDPTAGSGTTALMAEHWGRRWITCDTSRVVVTLSKQRLTTAVVVYFQLAQEAEGVGSGFKDRTVPHITLGSIANDEPASQETLYDQPLLDRTKYRVRIWRRSALATNASGYSVNPILCLEVKRRIHG